MAVAAGDAVDTTKIVNHEDAAFASMQTRERKTYKSWKGGPSLGAWEFEASAVEICQDTAPYRKYAKMSQGLNTLYKRDDITVAQAKGWAIKQDGWMPLVCAATKVGKARADVCGGEGADPLEVVEKRTVGAYGYINGLN